MKRRKTFGLLTGLFAFSLAIGAFSANVSYAEGKSIEESEKLPVPEIKVGATEFVLVPGDFTDEDAISFDEEKLIYEEDTHGGLSEDDFGEALPEGDYDKITLGEQNPDTMADYWNKFSSDYYRNQLTKKQRKLWDKLDAECYSYLSTEADVVYSKGNYRTNVYDYSSLGLSKEQVFQVIELFEYSNPQYYFLSNYYYLSSNYTAICIYSEFASGKVRREYTRKFSVQVNAWIDYVEQATKGCLKSELNSKRELEIHDLLCDEITYRENSYDQSVVSAVLLKKTVCAGYTKAMNMLCNYFGIESIAVFSTYDGASHTWNEVKLDGIWYVVDVTWDDGIYYTYRGAYNTTNDSLNQFFDDYKYHNTAYYDSTCKSMVPQCSTVQTKEYNYRIAAPTVALTESDDVITIYLDRQCLYSTIYYKTYTGTWDLTQIPGTVYYPYVGIKVDTSEFMNAYAVYGGGKSTQYQDSRVVSVGSVTVKFNTNGLNTTPSKKIGYIGGSVTMPSLKKGLSSGWNTEKNGSGLHLNEGETIDYVSLTPGDVVTLYAEAYTIEYDYNGGKELESNPSTYNKNTSTIYLDEPTRKGYVFEGWYSDSTSTEVITTIPKGSRGNIKLYAKWTPIKYTIRYSSNGADSGKVTKQSASYGTKVTLKKNGFVREGYIFTGWNTKEDGTGKTYTEGQKVRNLTTKNGSNVVLYAQWEEATYQITYKLNGGKNNKQNPKSYTINSKTIKLKTPTKEGYTFGGWYTNKSLTKKITKILAGSSKNYTLYAKWIKN